MSRTARVERTTKESSVVVELDLDGTGIADVSKIGRASCRERVCSVV